MYISILQTRRDYFMASGFFVENQDCYSGLNLKIFHAHDGSLIREGMKNNICEVLHGCFSQFLYLFPVPSVTNHHKVGGLKKMHKMHIYPFIVLEVRSLKSVSLDQNQGVSSIFYLLELYFLQLLAHDPFWHLQSQPYGILLQWSHCLLLCQILLCLPLIKTSVSSQGPPR